MKYVSEKEEDTLRLGKRLGERLSGGEIITLSGDLGAGKTTFTKGLACGLGVRDTVVSPTFTLMNEYEGRLTLYHYDAYRLSCAEEAYEAGLTEYFGDPRGVCVIEWWQNIAAALREYKTISVTLTPAEQDKRVIEIVDE